MSSRFKKYGLTWDADEFADPWEVEAAMYANPEFRDHSKTTAWEHLRAMIKCDYPDDVFAWHKWVDLIGETWCEENVMTVWGAASTGKSGVVAMLGWQELLIDPRETIVIVATYPHTMHQSRCWGSMKQWIGLSPSHRRKCGVLRSTPSMGFFTNDAAAQRSGVVCITAGPGEKEHDIQKKIGIHKPRAFFIADEPQGCSPSLLRVKNNFFASAKIGKECWMGNPKLTGDPLGMHSEPEDGDWSRVLKAGEDAPDSWKTRTRLMGRQGKCIVLDGRKCPTWDSPEEAERLHFLHQPEHMEDMRLTIGEDSPQYWEQIIGRIKPGGSSDQAMSMPDLEALGGRDVPKWRTLPVLWAGLDPATSDVDDAILKFAVEGTLMNGRHVGAVVSTHKLKILASAGDISGQVARQTAAIMRQKGVPPERLAVDCNGNQTAIADRIEAEFGVVKKIHRVLTGGKCKSRLMPAWQGGKDAAQVYNDEASWAFYRMIDLIQSRQLMNIDQQTAGEICGRLIMPENPKIEIESKESYRRRNKMRSPDNADALMQICVMWHDKGVLKAEGPPRMEPKNPAPGSAGRDPFEGIFGAPAVKQTVRDRHRQRTRLCRW